jgi:hypothetical protein
VITSDCKRRCHKIQSSNPEPVIISHVAINKWEYNRIGKWLLSFCTSCILWYYNITERSGNWICLCPQLEWWGGTCSDRNVRQICFPTLSSSNWDNSIWQFQPSKCLHILSSEDGKRSSSRNVEQSWNVRGWTKPRNSVTHECNKYTIITYLMWLWGHSLFNISSPGPVLYGTKWLLWRPHK